MARISVFALLSILIAGCVAIPLPEKEAVVYGPRFEEDKARTILSGAENVSDVIAKLGEPLVNFGPQRVFVYFWIIKKGAIAWVVAGHGSGVGGLEPWTESKLLLAAFDPDGKILKYGVEKFAPQDTLSEQVRNWLASNGLTDRVVGPQLEGMKQGVQILFVYRPSISACPFPLFDTGIFKPSIEVDNQIVGDLGKGEYLASFIEVGSHEIRIDLVPIFRTAGRESSSFAVHKNTIALNIDVESNKSVYIEAYMCTGMGTADMNAIVRDPKTAVEAILKLRPAW
jgi:hypothetical protein